MGRVEALGEDVVGVERIIHFASANGTDRLAYERRFS